MKYPFYSVFMFFIFNVNTLYAQSYMHEVAEESDGSFIDGVVAFFIIGGIIIFVKKLIDERSYEQTNDDELYEYENEQRRYDAEDKDDFYDYTPPTIVNVDGVDFNISEMDPFATSSAIENSKIEEVRINIISKYADNTELFMDILIIEENCEYHILTDKNDIRYQILIDFIPKYRPSNVTTNLCKYDLSIVSKFISNHIEKEKYFLHFNPIENLRLGNNDFQAYKIIILYAYYADMDETPIYKREYCEYRKPSLDIINRIDFFLSIGIKETLRIHKSCLITIYPEDWIDLKIASLNSINNYKDLVKLKEYRDANMPFWRERHLGYYEYASDIDIEGILDYAKSTDIEEYNRLRTYLEEGGKLYRKTGIYNQKKALEEIKEINDDIKSGGFS